MPMRKSRRRSDSSGIALGLSALHTDGTPQSVDHTVKLYEQAVAHGLDQPAMMFRERGLENLVLVGLKARARPLLVCLTQPAIAGDVCDQDGGEPPLHPLCPRWRIDSARATYA
jgi:hypothetical protein